MKRVAIVQSNYIPWKGYFDIIASVDEFVLYDDMQFTRRDWRNRNQIKTPQGLAWLSVPVKVKGRYHQTIRETEIDGDDWIERHLRSLELNYVRAPHFKEVFGIVEPIYGRRHSMLSALNRDLLEALCAYLDIGTTIRESAEFTLADGKSERLADLSKQLGADEYTSGPAARGYLEEQAFADLGIAVRWFDYSDYPEYPQLWGEFQHGVTVLDLLFNCGKDAPSFMKFAPR